jgi:hypothetical protein
VSTAQPRSDLAGSAGLLAAHQDLSDDTRGGDDWLHAVQGAVTFGRHLSPHVKLELDASATTAGTQYRSRAVDVPGFAYPYWVTSTVTTSVRTVASTVLWQFRENEWVHPFVAAGVAVDIDRVDEETPEHRYGPPSQPVLVTEAQQVERTDVRASPLVAAGAKLYFTERAFVRTEMRVAWTRSRQAVVFRAGIGFDF